MTRRQRDQGVTLVELLVVISLLGLVMAVLAATFTLIVRINPTNEARADGSRALLGLTTWLPEDVSSTPPGSPPGGGFELDGVACGAVAAGQTALLALRTTDPRTGVVYGRDYRLVDASGEPTVQRRACVIGGGSSPSTNQVTGPLSVPSECDAPPIAASARVRPITDAQDRIAGVKFDVLIGCEMVTVDATSNNPNEPPLDPSNTVPSPGTSAPPANDPPVLDPADFNWSVAVGSSTEFVVQATDPDGDALTLTLSATPDPVASGVAVTVIDGTLTLSIVVDALATAGEISDPIEFSVSDGTVAVPGTITLTVVSDPSLASSTTTTVPPSPTTLPCTGATITGYEPTNLTFNNGTKDNVGTLNKDLVVTINRGSNCPQLGLLFAPRVADDDGPQLADLAWRSFDGATVLTIDRNALSWSDGFHTLALRNFSDGTVVYDSITIEVR